jgi:DNA-binding beta-propeller fold protein YncE
MNIIHPLLTPGLRLFRRPGRGGAAVLAAGFAVGSAVCAGTATPAAAAAQEPPSTTRPSAAGPPTPSSPGVALASPTRLAPGPLPRTLLVADSQRRAVFLLDSGDLSPRLEIAVAGRPSAVAALPPWIYIGDETGGAVAAYNPAGRHLFDFEGPVQRPADIAVSRQQRLVFVVDAAAGEVKVFRDRGSLAYSFGGGDTQPRLIHPTGIAYDPERREVLVSDFGDPVAGIPARVQIYTELGEHRATLSEAGQERAFQFSRPQGLAVAEGRIFLVDSLLGQVLVFDRETLTGVEARGGYGAEEGELLLPLDVARDPASGRLFVTSNRTGRIEIFDDGGTP